MIIFRIHQGGGIFSRYDSYSIVANSILWNNADIGGNLESSQIFNDSDAPYMPSVSHSCIQGLDTLSGNNNISGDPKFIDPDGLDDLVGTEDDDLRLLGNSPCINVGDNLALPSDISNLDGDDDTIEPIPLDHDGNLRILDGIIDLGAYEGQNQGFLLNTETVVVPEGSTANFSVALAMDPGGSVEVSAAVASGDPDISVVPGQTLIFNSSNSFQDFTLAAAEDQDYLDGATLVIITAQDIPTRNIGAIEDDNEAVPTVLYVDKSANGLNDGTSWTNAFGDLQTALDIAEIAVEVKEIRVAQGIYTPTDPNGRLATFKLVAGTSLRGGYAGLSGPDPDARDFNIYETILSGDLNGDDVPGDPNFSFDNSYHVVSGGVGPDANSVLDGFTITAGFANGDEYGDEKPNRGAGLYRWGSTISTTIVTNCTFVNNYTTGKGAGVYSYHNSFILHDCIFIDNHADIEGGGVYCNSTTNPKVVGCTFTNNSAGNGAGMYGKYTDITVENCTFEDNDAFDFKGGGIYGYSGSLTITDCNFISNSGFFSAGGVSAEYYCDLTMTDCVVSKNSAQIGAGVDIYDNCNAALTNCQVTSNSAESYAAGIKSTKNCIVTMTACTITDNSAELEYGGGVVNSKFSNMLMTNCTISKNSAGTSGGGVYSGSYSVTTLNDCIINGNNARDGGGLYCLEGAVSLTSSVGDFSGTQGEGNWYYGYYEIVDPCVPYSTSDFEEFPNFNGTSWYIQTMWDGVPIWYWTSLSDSGGHPNGPVTSNGSQEVEHWAIRRWVSNIEGTVNINGALAKENADCGDGMEGYILLDGEEIWSQAIEFDDNDGVDYEINVIVSIGSIIEFVIAPGQENDFCDGSRFTANIMQSSNIQNPILTDCVISNNIASENGGGVYSELCNLKLDNCTLFGNSAGNKGGEIYNDNGILTLGGDSTVTDSGSIYVGPLGEIVVSDDAVLNLVDLSNPLIKGQVECYGMFRAKDRARVSNVYIEVARASFEGDVNITGSTIKAQTGSPEGQFVVEGSVTIIDNDIHADGDRYMDFDYREEFNGILSRNRIYVTITEGVGDTRGGLLELRGEDGWTYSDCDPNSFFCESEPGTIPDFDPNTWTLEELRLVEGAKVNLTNRFDYGEGYYEVMYVKNLILDANSVLNTSFNRLYYDPCSAKIDDFAIVKNEPLLGFSLNNIAFDEEEDFLTRIVHNNFTNLKNHDFNRPYVQWIEGEFPDPAGMMKMTNLKDTDPNSPTCNEVFNARAKGLFSKSNEEEILIWFEYMFETSSPDTELVIYLTDVPELLDHDDPSRSASYIEVARLLPPLSGQPGSVGSGRFGMFKKYVSRRNLDFIKGTRIELELLGSQDGICVYINNFDPQVHCDGVCRDVTWDTYVNGIDFLTVIGEYGQSAGVTQDNSRACLDGMFSTDGYVDSADLVSWDWLLNSGSQNDLCQREVPLSGGASSGPSSAIAFGLDKPVFLSLPEIVSDIMIIGKRNDTSIDKFKDRLYSFDNNYLISDNSVPAMERANSKLIKDNEGEVYLINSAQGLIRLSDDMTIIDSDYFTVTEPRYGTLAEVTVGLQGSTPNWYGRPIQDVAFDPQYAVDNNYIYVTPVVVNPLSDPNLVYTAAAKIRLTSPANYQVLQIYDDPNASSPKDNRKLNGIRELEIDSENKLFVVNVNSENESDIIWVYDTYGKNDGIMLKRLELTDPNNEVYIPAPIGLHVSDDTDTLYLASSQGPRDANYVSIYGLSTDNLQLERTIEIEGMCHVTDITEDTESGTLWVSGFSMENIPEKPLFDEPPFYYPYLAQIPLENDNIEAVNISEINDPNNCDLALPLSIVWTGSMTCDRADFNNDTEIDYKDFGILAWYWLEVTCNEGNSWCEDSDTDKNGWVELNDLIVLARCWLESTISCAKADFNNDTEINYEDFGILAWYWLEVPCNEGNSWCEDADTDKSGWVDLDDLFVAARFWLETNCN